MEIFLVGGAVRDELLGLPIHERDWVIVGGSPEALIAQGFVPVGKDFPVFLHPKTHEEYALARTERKTGKGYKGFHFYASDDVTLEEDLKRRDLTINAIAKSSDGHYIDPYHGIEDIKNKTLRHVSDAFAEDPVRILRIARFASRFPAFIVHPDTNQLMKNMVNAGEVDALVSERVWKEMSRALAATKPTQFFHVLANCCALAKLFPTFVDNKKGLTALSNAADTNAKTPVRFAALCHTLSETQGKALCRQYRVPNEYAELTLLIIKYLSIYQSLDLADHEAVLAFLKRTDGLRRKARFIDFLNTCEIIDSTTARQKPVLLQALDTIKQVDITPLLSQNLKGMDFANALTQLQLQALAQLITR